MKRAYDFPMDIDIDNDYYISDVYGDLYESTT